MTNTNTWHQLQRSKHRETLLAAAKDVLVRRGMLNVKITELCTAAGVSRVTFYKNFQSMDELILELQIDILEHMTGQVGAADRKERSGRERLKDMLEAWVDYAGRQPDNMKFILLFDVHFDAAASDSELHSRYSEFVRTKIERNFLVDPLEAGIADGSLASGLEPLETSRFIFTAMMAVLQKRSLRPVASDSNLALDTQMGERFVKMILEFVSPDA